MPKPYPREFRENVVAAKCRPEGGRDSGGVMLRPFGAARDGGDRRCDSGRHSPNLSPSRVCLALGGLAILIVGVLVAPGSLPIGPVLITAGGVVLLLGVALPLVNQVELGAPMLAKVTIAANGRRDQIRGVVEDSRGLIVACAADLCPDGDSAARAVAASLSEALGTWHGTDNFALRRYLLCVLIQQARFEATTHPRPTVQDDPFLLLPQRDREVLVLVGRAGLGQADAASLLGVSPTEMSTIQARAMERLGLSGDIS